MPSKIRVLDEHTINKIAAGEVIENPSSVVKELVENSIDAGSTEICVEIKGGGRQLIRITDNGCGMNSDDALLCLERHATSKIKEIEDIHSIYTMGFRGEAIPSIASISKFTLMTCPKQEGESTSEEKKGTMVIVDGGKIMQCCPITRSPGTTIEVKSLFFNVPVRRKFQKSPAYDANEIQKMFNGIALGNPSIKFELIVDQKVILKTHQEENADFTKALKQRVSEVMGNEFSSFTCPIEIQKGEFFLQGLIGTPDYTRHNRTGQMLFINKRPVVSHLVSFAVKEGYGTALPSNRHPVFVLHLTIPGKMVDVNVHPQKREVRLRQELVLKDMIMQAVREGLQKSGPAIFSTTSHFNTIPDLPSFDSSAQIHFEPPIKNNFFDIAFSSPEISPVLPSFSKTEQPACAPSPQIKQSFTATEFSYQPTYEKLLPKILATIKNYILVDSSTIKNGDQSSADGLCIIDQKSAHSRIIFERILEKKNKDTPLQTLLIPYTFETTPLESSLLTQHIEHLQNIGIHLRQSGPNAFLVESIPDFFGNTDMRSLINELLHYIREGGTETLKIEQEKHIALAASKAAVSQQRTLSFSEAQSLVNQLLECKAPFQCPQGKPTMIFLIFNEIAKRFQK